MNPTPPIPAPEGEVPPRVRRVHTDSGLRVFYYAVDSESYKMAEKLAAVYDSGVDLGPEYVSLFEHQLALSAEKQRGLRAVEEARAKAFEEVCQKWESTAVDTSEYVYWIFEERRKAKAQASRAAKEPS